jgi:hypothetical protein
MLAVIVCQPTQRLVMPAVLSTSTDPVAHLARTKAAHKQYHSHCRESCTSTFFLLKLEVEAVIDFHLRLAARARRRNRIFISRSLIEQSSRFLVVKRCDKVDLLDLAESCVESSLTRPNACSLTFTRRWFLIVFVEEIVSNRRHVRSLAAC